jgi:type IV secretion system protein TrbL
LLLSAWWLGGAHAQEIPPGPASLNPDAGLVAQFKHVKDIWVFRLFTPAQSLFWWLARLEFVIGFVFLVAAQAGINALMTGIFKKIVWIGFFFTFLSLADTWIDLILQSFMQVGSFTTGVAKLSPGEVFGSGWAIAGRMLKEMAGWGLINPKTWISAMVGLFCVVTVVISFGRIAVEMAITLIEAYTVMGASVFVLAFAVFRGTAAIAERFLGFVIAIGLKLLVIYLIIGAGHILFAIWLAEISPESMAGYTTPVYIAANAYLFSYVVRHLPSVANSLAIGAVGFSASEVIGAAVNTIRMTIAAGAAAASSGGVGLGAVGVAGATATVSGGGVRGALMGAGSAAKAIGAEALRSNTPRLSRVADNMSRRMENIRAGMGNRP